MILKTWSVFAALFCLAGCVWCSSGCDYYQPEKPEIKKAVKIGEGQCRSIGVKCSGDTGNVRYDGWAAPLRQALQEQDVLQVVTDDEPADYTVQIDDMTIYKFEDMCNMVLPLTLGLMPCMSTTEYNLKIKIADNNSGEVKTLDFQPRERWFGHILLMPFAIIEYHTVGTDDNIVPSISRHIANMVYEEIKDK